MFFKTSISRIGLYSFCSQENKLQPLSKLELFNYSMSLALCSKLTALRSQLSAQNSQLSALCSKLTALGSLLKAQCSLLTALRSMLNAHSSYTFGPALITSTGQPDSYFLKFSMNRLANCLYFVM